MKTIKEAEEIAEKYALEVFPLESDLVERSQHWARNRRSLIKLGYMRCFNDLQRNESEKVTIDIPFSKNVLKSS